MSVPELSVRRPIAVLMAVLAVSIFGVLASRNLPVELLPDISYPTVTIETEYPDAAPLSVEQFVTRPVEEAVGVIPGVREMLSVSRPSRSEVILEFDWDQNMDTAALEVREKLGTVDLPREAEMPRVLRFDPSLEPVLRIAFSGDRPLGELRQLAERWLAPRLEGVVGVAAAKVRGGLEQEVVVEVDEDRLAALGIGLGDLAQVLEAENVNQPGGTLRDFNALYLVRTLHEFEDLDQIRRTVVREGANGRVRVEDLAKVSWGHRDREEMARLGGLEVVELGLYREGSANTVLVARAIREELAELEEELSQGLSISVLADQSRYIASAVDEVKSAAVFGGLLAIAVLLFFLRDVASTAIIGMAIPISVAATFLPMQQAGISLNIMSLGGLALGVGMLVDSSIVVLEAIDRHRREGKGRRAAAMDGASEVAGAVTASILTTVCVFLPIVFVKGIAGQLFRDQALTVCFSLLASLVVSLTLIPALAAFDPGAWQRGRSPEKDLPWTLRLGPLRLLPVGDGSSWSSRLWTVLFFPLRLPLLLLFLLVGVLAKVLGVLLKTLAAPLAGVLSLVNRAYPGTLQGALRRRGWVLATAFLLLVLSVLAVPQLGTRLVPELTQGEFAFQLRLPEGTTLETTAETVAQVEKDLLADTTWERMFSVIGSLPSSASGRRTLGENLAQLDFVLPPGAQRADQERAVARVRAHLVRFPRLEAELLESTVLAMKPPVAVRLFAEDLGLLEQAAETVRSSLGALAGVIDVNTTVEPGSPEVQVTLDRDRASSLGLSNADVANALRQKIQGEVVGQLREGEERFDIRLRAAEAFRDRASQVEDLRLPLAGGTAVPVAAVAAVNVGRGPAAIYRADGSRMAEVTAKTEAADLGTVLTQVRQEVLVQDLGAEVSTELAGQDEELRVSFQSLRLALALAVFLVYGVMAAQFESLFNPFVILISVPLALTGVVGALWLRQEPISVLVLIGLVMLAGIVVNNAIVLVDAVNRRRREGQDLAQALVGAGGERLRPILMTTATTVLGLTPMALGLGAGGELRAPLAITVIGGLVASTLLTLVVIPCMYAVMTREKLDLSREALALARERAASQEAERDAAADSGEPGLAKQGLATESS